ncbi:hypothetical protein EV363DRAFT_1318444, partial [Boletus edulis]
MARIYDVLLWVIVVITTFYISIGQGVWAHHAGGYRSSPTTWYWAEQLSERWEMTCRIMMGGGARIVAVTLVPRSSGNSGIHGRSLPGSIQLHGALIRVGAGLRDQAWVHMVLRPLTCVLCWSLYVDTVHTLDEGCAMTGYLLLGMD